MKRAIARLPLLLSASMGVLLGIASSVHAIGIVEPDFTTADPEKATSLKAFVSQPGPGPQREGKSRTFTVEPESFTPVKNDTDFDIADLHLTILTEGFEWGDANGDGVVFGGRDNFYLRTVSLSADKKTIWLAGGLINKGKAFDPLFDVKDFPEGGVRMNGYFTIVPEPSTVLGLGIGLAGLAGFARRRLAKTAHGCHFSEART